MSDTKAELEEQIIDLKTQITALDTAQQNQTCPNCGFNAAEHRERIEQVQATK